MTRYLALLAGALLALAGCSRTLDRPQRTMAIGAPASWETPSALPQQPVSAWWIYFSDSGLDEAITTALEQNQDLVAAAARVEASEAQTRIAGAPLLPSADVAFERNRQRLNFIGLPVPGGEDAVLKTINTNIGLSLNVGWEPDVWGRIQASKLAATADGQALQADLVGAKLSLSGQTAKAWFSAIEAKRQLQLARASLESFDVSAERVRARFMSGVRPSLDLRLALTEVERAKANVEQRRQTLDGAIRQLETLMGAYPEGAYELAEDLPRPPPGIPAGLPSELVHRRPDLIAAERRLLASDARIAESEADLRPRFNLTSAAGTTTNRLQDVLSGDVLVWSLFSGVAQPLFNNGRLRAEVRQNEAQAAEEAANYERAVLEAYREVEVAMAADAFLAHQEDALEAATRQALEAQGLAEDRYRSGLTDIITLLESQRTALDAESSLLAVRRTRLDNRVDLHLALGGGFSTTGAAPGPAIN